MGNKRNVGKKPSKKRVKMRNKAIAKLSLASRRKKKKGFAEYLEDKSMQQPLCDITNTDNINNTKEDNVYDNIDNTFNYTSLQNVMPSTSMDVDEERSNYTTLQNVMPSTSMDVYEESLVIQGENTSLHDLERNDKTEEEVLEVKEPQKLYIKKKNENKQKRKQQSRPYRIGTETNEVEEGGEERRIVDLFYFIKKLQKLSDHSPFDCKFSDLSIKGLTPDGLNSKILLKCKMCNRVFRLDTCDPKPKKTINVNEAAISGMTVTGIGISQFSELLSAMNIPPMGVNAYEKAKIKISKEWEKSALLAMEEAANREREAAIAEGRVKDGIAVIDVIADGCWSKRSYKCNYSALSGAAAIIGRKFGEVLYFGVKNKYCCVCSRAENKGIEPKEHACYKNYSGSSTAMEADIIAEGFKISVETQNLIYGRLIADGDSSTYNKIINQRPYPNHHVEKIECRNHLLRNLCNKLNALTKDTKYNLSRRKLFTSSRIMAIRKVVLLSIQANKNGTGTLSERINQLYVDITNSYNHAFGNHNQCKDYYCSSEKKSEDMTKKLVGTPIWIKTQYYIGLVAANAKSLINDTDSNIVETFNSIVAKFVGGKRINYSLKDGYQNRVTAAVVSFNTKTPIYTLQKNIIGQSPSSKSKKLELKRAKKVKCQRLRPKVLFRPATTRKSLPTDKSYGEECQRPDVSPEELERLKNTFLSNLEKTQEQRQRIEKDTILQRDSSEWLELRRQLLTASNFGKIIKKRETTGPTLVRTLLYKQDLSNIKSIRHGVTNEANALNQLSTQLGITIQNCGLFVDAQIPYLGATPDGLVGDDKVVEIKCPLSVYKQNLKDVDILSKLPFFKKKDGTLVVNKKHDWFYQVQGQLHIAQKKSCILGIWAGENNDLHIEIIERDDEFWDKCMVNKLKSFYMTHILPELVDPRQTRNLPLRDCTISSKRNISQVSGTEGCENDTIKKNNDTEINSILTFQQM